MKTVYKAGNALEAQMLLDLLKQDGITAHIRGAHLQGAIGELPAAGLVRLEVLEDDHARAREVIDRWEAANPLGDTPVGGRRVGWPRRRPLSLGAARLERIGAGLGPVLCLDARARFHRGQGLQRQ